MIMFNETNEKIIEMLNLMNAEAFEEICEEEFMNMNLQDLACVLFREYDEGTVANAVGIALLNACGYIKQ